LILVKEVNLREGIKGEKRRGVPEKKKKVDEKLRHEKSFSSRPHVGNKKGGT